jgi:excisionase family DNA binding protein
MESTKEAEVEEEGIGLDDLVSLRRPLTGREITSLWPRLALAMQRFIESLARREAQVADLEQRAHSAGLLTPKQAAQRLAVHESFVRQAGRDGRIPFVKVGSYVRFAPSVIERVEREGLPEARPVANVAKGVPEARPDANVANLSERRQQRSRTNAA